MKSVSMLTFALALAILSIPSSCEAQGFTQSYSTPIDIGGYPNRYAPSATNFNGNYYVAYTDQSGYVNIAVGASGSQYVSSGTRVSTPSGAVTSSWNPAIMAVGSTLYLSYVVGNSTAYLTASTNGTTWARPVAVAVPSGTLVDSPALGTVNNFLYVGLHNNSSKTILVCHFQTLGAPTPLSSVCYNPPTGSTYGPGLVGYNNSLYTFFEYNDSAHTINYYVSPVNQDGSLSQFNLMADTNVQTSAQPAVVVNGNSILLAYRSNDASAHFDYKFYTAGSGWSANTSTTFGISGAPALTSGGPQFPYITTAYFGANASPYILNYSSYQTPQ